MKSIILCNTGSDSLSKIRLCDNFIENCTLSLGETPIGPQGIFIGKDTIYTANSYNHCISKINLENFTEEKQIYFGANPHDLMILGDVLLVVCNDSNSVIIYDLKVKDVILQVPTGLCPMNIEGDEALGKVIVSNFGEDTITVIDTNDDYSTNKYITGECPSKIKLSKDNRKLFICESNVRYDQDGYIGVYSTDDFHVIKRVKVGKCPIDMWIEDRYLYISNFYDGTVSVVEIDSLKEIERISIGGMPKGIVRYENKLYVTDYYYGQIKIIDLENRKIKAITVGMEPNAMTLN